MMPAALAASRIHRNPVRGKNILPSQLSGGVRILSFQGEGQVNIAQTRLQVLLVEKADPVDLLPEERFQLLRKHGHAILHALSVPDDNLVLIEIHILHP